MMRRRRALALAFVVALAAPAVPVQAGSVPARFVDEASCASCHAAESAAWTGSQHDLAMQDANQRTVLGDFGGATFEYAGVTSRFFRRDGKYFVRTDGPDGALADFEVKSTFGVAPLQQYLIELSGGRVQALSIAWDTVGKRWFHLYPDERIDFRDELHWTKPLQNWNHMCGACHATGYRKNYDPATDTYATTAARFDVGCQACHGPASRHLEAVRAGAEKRPAAEVRRDFDVDLRAGDARVEIETCARCHARRSTLTAGDVRGAVLMDTHLPALLDEGLYFADGQIEDEVYVYGSFLQSRMHAVGVRCSDCHEPHAAALRAAGNALCTRCHNAKAPAATRADTGGLREKNYDSPQHHFHQAGKPGSACVDCHAPTRTYMVVDPRRDHSFRIPRPDLSGALGTPNACNLCHDDKSAQWAAAAIDKWYGSERPREKHYGEAIAAGRNGRPGAVASLIALAGDGKRPAIARATGLDLLGRYPGRSVLQAAQSGLRDADPLVRRAAMRALEQLPPAQRVTALAPLLADPVRAVRIEAARLLAPAAASLDAGAREKLDAAWAELEAAYRENADQSEALTRMADDWLARGELGRAEPLYVKAIARDARYIPAYVNLADLYRRSGRDGEAERLLRQGLAAAPQAPGLRGALGLLLVRDGRKEEALAELAAAADGAPDDAWHNYVYAVALHDAGRRAEAIAVLRKTAARVGDRDVLLALAAYEHESGNDAGAGEALRSLAAINPGDPALSR